MKCPRCDGEMQAGYIHNGSQPVQWIPAGKKASPFSFSKSKAGITLINKFEPFKTNGYTAEAYFCPDCKIVVAEIDK
ncbi:MAG: PF20097 family protein [Bacillota bacterium]|nr:PF20097 family protein [Bacillota bacterium]